MSTAELALRKRRYSFFYSPQFQLWSIIGIFILLTLHYYDDQINIVIISFPDEFLGLTKHTIDRILYLVPIILSSFVFGARGGFIASIASLLAMVPRALFISLSPTSALLETFAVMLIGSIVPLRIDYYERQGEKLEMVMERLEVTQRRLHLKVRVSMEQSKQLAVINAFSAILSQSLDLNQTLKTATNMVMDVAQVEVVLIFCLDAETKRLRLNAFKGIGPESAKALDGMKLGSGFCGRVAESGQPLLVEDIMNSPELCDITTLQERFRTQLSVPLIARGKIMGTLCIATRSQRQFKDPEIELLSALGNLIGIAIDNFGLYRGREIANDQLKVSEKKYRQLFENAHDAIWVQDLSGNITAANQAAARLFGCGLSELIGSDSQQFLTVDGREHSKLMQEKLFLGQGTQEPYTQKFIKKDGCEAILMITTNFVLNNGIPYGMQFIGRDITNEVRMLENQSFYLKQITNAHEEERLRISRDLHDSTAQNLIAGLHRLEDFCKTTTYLPESDVRSLWDLYEQLKDALHEIRQLSRDLRPSIIDDLGLLPAVEWLVEQLKTEHKIEANLVVSGEEHRFAPEMEVALFRIVQEALRNIAKHAGATEVQVSIGLEDTKTEITISDNGKGFEMPRSLGEFSRIGKLGVDGMQTRAKLAGGTFTLRSEQDKGTTVHVTIPSQAPHIGDTQSLSLAK